VAVIINDLEVVVDAEEARAPEEAERREEAAPPLRPEDINDIVERRLRLLTRVLAH
jgi:hypothetical protein